VALIGIGLVVDIEHQRHHGVRVADPHVALELTERDYPEITQIRFPVMTFADLPDQGEQAVAVRGLLREAARAGQPAAAHIEPISTQMPIRRRYGHRSLLSIYTP
jgi:hypothetical protein